MAKVSVAMPQISEDEIKALKERVAFIESDPYARMYEGLLKQWNDIAADLARVKISIDGDDKSFDRFAKLVEKLGPMTDSIEKLRKKIGIEAEDSQKKKAVNPIESSLKSK
jgi:hypothetical protein